MHGRSPGAGHLRSLAATVVALAYWGWATVALGTAYLARAASEDPPFSEESVVLRLSFGSWLLASASVIGLRGRWRGSLLFGLWAVQAVLLVAALIATLGPPGGIRVAPTLMGIGFAGELAGLVAVALSVGVRLPAPGPVRRTPERP